jgi:G3E family GTPase
MNAHAPVTRVDHGRADIPDILAIGGFDLTAGAELDDLAAHADHRHADDIASFVVREGRAYELEKLEGFMSLLVERFGPDMLRYKGVLNVAGREERIVFQGVHGLLGSEPGKMWRDDETRSSTMVFIGRRLPRASFEKGLAWCVEGSAADPAVALREAA